MYFSRDHLPRGFQMLHQSRDLHASVRFARQHWNTAHSLSTPCYETHVSSDYTYAYPRDTVINILWHMSFFFLSYHVRYPWHWQANWKFDLSSPILNICSGRFSRWRVLTRCQSPSNSSMAFLYSSLSAEAYDIDHFSVYAQNMVIYDI